MAVEKMKVEVSGGINWTWFKVQNGKLVAVFRLHHGEDAIMAFRKLRRNMGEVSNIPVPMATWREPCDRIASHCGEDIEGYNLPEVGEAFAWLNDMFRGVADAHELNFCPEGTMRHLEYHGVAIVRVK